MMNSAISSAVERAAVGWRGLDPGRKAFVAAAAMGAAVFTGAVTAGRRDSISGQTVAYAGVLGLLASAPAYAVGRGALAVASRNADTLLQQGTIQAERAADMVAAARARSLRPARVMAMSSAGLAAGVAAGNLTFHQAQRSLGQRLIEQQDEARPAVKSGG